MDECTYLYSFCIISNVYLNLICMSQLSCKSVTVCSRGIAVFVVITMEISFTLFSFNPLSFSFSCTR